MQALSNGMKLMETIRGDNDGHSLSLQCGACLAFEKTVRGQGPLDAKRL